MTGRMRMSVYGIFIIAGLILVHRITSVLNLPDTINTVLSIITTIIIIILVRFFEKKEEQQRINQLAHNQEVFLMREMVRGIVLSSIKDANNHIGQAYIHQPDTAVGLIADNILFKIQTAFLEAPLTWAEINSIIERELNHLPYIDT